MNSPLNNDAVLLPQDTAMLSTLSNQTVIVTGGTGLIGRALVSQLLILKVKRIILFSRSRTRAFHPSPIVNYVQYDATHTNALTGDALKAIQSADIIFNLAGEPIDDGRWTNDRKEILRNSRITGTKRIASMISSNPNITLISSSAVGVYGTSETSIHTEYDKLPMAPNDFLATLAREWEQATVTSENKPRTVIIRTGVVLSNEGGILQAMLRVFKAFLGGAPGTGKQWLSWVHIDDITRLLLYTAADKKYNGIYNGTAPNPVRLDEFCKSLGDIIGRPSWLPVPKAAITLLLGTEAAQLVLAGQRVIPKRTQSAGFLYRYKDIKNALKHLILKPTTVTKSKNDSLTNSSTSIR